MNYPFVLENLPHDEKLLYQIKYVNLSAIAVDLSAGRFPALRPDLPAAVDLPCDSVQDTLP
jgi:hypothetical protein